LFSYPWDFVHKVVNKKECVKIAIKNKGHSTCWRVE
jgi:hypothetical protein